MTLNSSQVEFHSSSIFFLSYIWITSRVIAKIKVISDKIVHITPYLLLKHQEKTENILSKGPKII